MFQLKSTKSKLITTTIIGALLFTIPAATGFAAADLVTNTQDIAGTYNLTPVFSDQLLGYVQNYVKEDSRLRNWKMLDNKITLTTSEQSGSEISAVFDVERQYTLSFAKAEDAPAVKGRLDFISKNGKGLSKKQLDKANKELANWKHDITEYINSPQNSFDRIKVVAQLDANNTIVVNSIKFSAEGPIGGEFLPISLSDIPSEDKVLMESAEAIKATAISTAPDVSAMALYQRLLARNYVQTWTSNTTKVCSGGSSKQDAAYYNTKQYTTWYACNDCANYVSQGSRAGGIPTDTTWKPYTSAWIGVTALKDYMLTKGRWKSATSNNVNECVAGYPFRLSSGSHFMMMSSNDGVTRKYCAHTSDRKDSIWYTSTGAYYYKVVY